MLEEKTYLNIFEDKDIAIFVSEEQKMIMHKFASKVSTFRPFIGNHRCKTNKPHSNIFFKKIIMTILGRSYAKHFRLNEVLILKKLSSGFRNISYRTYKINNNNK